MIFPAMVRAVDQALFASWQGVSWSRARSGGCSKRERVPWRIDLESESERPGFPLNPAASPANPAASRAARNALWQERMTESLKRPPRSAASR
jgi:hypothetical protein